ncbi:MAG: FAD-dependent thymidylate synthase [candidate division Zixibacteria bacterium]|nr:FAD-dependent thymidylate synthase [candidate division Zixibacteria bacterium]
MKLLKQSYEILSFPTDLEQLIEIAGRTCYQSQDKITDSSSIRFCNKMVESGHHAMIEFGNIIVRFITNRGVTHELVRHRLCSFAQESTRYVKYGKDMEFIEPVWWKITGEVTRDTFKNSLRYSCDTYCRLIDFGWKPQEAREVLPNALKTEIVVNANVREWRHILTLRCAKTAHPQMRALMIPLLEEFTDMWPGLFMGIKLNY